MPCPKCDTPFLVSDKYENLRCPECDNIEYIEPGEIASEIKDVLNLLTDDNIFDRLSEYSKTNLLLYLMNHLNGTAHELYETRGMQANQFIYLGYLIKSIYQQSGFGEKQLEPGDELAEPVQEAFDTQIKIPRKLNEIEDQSKFALPKPVMTGRESIFWESIIQFDSEYRYCWRRCAKSLLGGGLDELENFDKVSQETRDFDKPDSRESLTDFAETFFEFILGIAFTSSSDKMADTLHGELLPDSADIMDLKTLMDRIDSDLGEDAVNYIHQDGTLAALDTAKVDAIGRQVFDNWNAVRDAIIIGDSNPDAHPFFFEVEYEQVIKEPAGRDPVTVPQPGIIYLRHYVYLLRMQLFPMMTEGDELVGHEILSEVCEKRGPEFERNVYQSLRSRGYTAYHSSWYTKSDQREIDIIVPMDSDEEIWFIECKYFLPELEMGTAEGIKDLNDKFNREVFPDDGESFHEKVDIWTEEKPGNTFLEDGQDDRPEIRYQQEWRSYDVKKMVVSNLVPSYLEKSGVKFYTDKEFLEILDGESSVYTYAGSASIPIDT